MRFVRGLSDPPDELDLAALRAAVANEGVAVAVLFGSRASGTEGPLSDLDVAVAFHDHIPEERRWTLLDELTAAITATTGFEAIDLVDLETAGPRLGYEALANGVFLYGDRSLATDLEAEFLLRWLDFKPVKRAWDDALTSRIRDGTYGRP